MNEENNITAKQLFGGVDEYMEELTGLEALKVIRPCANTCGDYDDYCNIIEKELQVFQLLFNKNILNANNRGIITIWENGNTYGYELQILLDKDCVIIPLTKEEYETFKRGIQK